MCIRDRLGTVNRLGSLFTHPANLSRLAAPQNGHMTEPEMPLRTGLPAIVGADPRVLILGSFPSEKSLDTGEY